MTPQQAIEYICLAAEQVIPVAQMKKYQEAYNLLLSLANSQQAPPIDSEKSVRPAQP